MSAEGIDTMTDTQLTAWVAEQQRLSALLTAQREQKAKYPGNPGTPLSIRREQRHKKKEPCQQAAFKCVHRWRLEECTGSPVLMGTCGYCGATREFRASYNEEPVPMRKMQL